ncbi:hypothetical protein BDN72DRAFT_884840 [Pluteus cervinus]|uniref:Uncharacterized protein n=1 Tax=Pluteus cervinus TaxID=181527 RepID=A0ACD3BHQ5_9AGAR|nr:hypothetical protein BDN72DRAFT_884840 [Pluteus cervinus]
MSDTKPTPKLTKKQKKALAFRERKGKGKDNQSRSNGMDMEIHDVPAMEDEDSISVSGVEVQVAFMGGKTKNHSEDQVGRNTKRDGDTSKTKDGMVEKSSKKKRKLDGEGESTQQTSEAEPKPKKARRGDDEDVSAVQLESDEQRVVAKGKERFILFVGNLKYTTSADAISAHFGICDPPPSVRLLTPKQNPESARKTNKSKGCAFLEFTHRNALQQGLKLHHTELDGRIINVELTAGGGGKGENRLKKVQERNKALVTQRTTRSQKEGDEQPPKPVKAAQRYSSTSGVGQKPVEPKTWTVGDVDEAKSKRAKKREKKVKPWGTGVNAIPVG